MYLARPEPRRTMLAMTDPTDTYEQGRQGDSYNPAGNGSLEDQYNYQDGQAERAEQERRAVDDARSTAEQQQRWRDERDATDRQSQPSYNTSSSRAARQSSTTMPSPTTSTRRRYRSDDALKNPESFNDLVGGLVVIAGGIGWAVSAFVLHRPDILIDVLYVVVGMCVLIAVVTLANLRSTGFSDALAGAIIYGLLAAGGVYLAQLVFTKPEWLNLLAPAVALGALFGTLVGEHDAIAAIGDAEG
jgi:VIT1/CCC1 family predicted Fe2+/Mn2+ transporter